MHFTENEKTALLSALSTVIAEQQEQKTIFTSAYNKAPDENTKKELQEDIKRTEELINDCKNAAEKINADICVREKTMPFNNTTITQAAHEQFFKDMQRGNYTSADFQRYNAEAGWQEWMNEYTDALPTETCSEQETNNITAVQRKMWDQFWQEAAKAIEEAERNYHGDFVSRCKISKKPDAFDIYTFNYDGDTYEYDLGSNNGEHYAGWNTRTKEYCKIFDLAVEIEEDEYADLGIILSKI